MTDDDREHYRAAVERGAALLDRVRPGWQAQVNPETLDMARSGRCVLGQLYDDFFEGRYELEDQDWGFDPDEHGFSCFAVRHYDFVRGLWVEQIGRRATP